MRRLRFLSLMALVALMGGVGSDAQQQSTPMPASRIDVSKLGPQVGDRVPDFSLQDQDGRTQTLQSIMGPRGAMLVFIRSADW